MQLAIRHKATVLKQVGNPLSRVRPDRRLGRFEGIAKQFDNTSNNGSFADRDDGN